MTPAPIEVDAPRTEVERATCSTKKCERTAVKDGLCGRCHGSARARSRQGAPATSRSSTWQAVLDARLERLEAETRERLAQR